MEREYSTILSIAKKFTTNYTDLANQTIIELHNNTKIFELPKEKIPPYLYNTVKYIFFAEKRSEFKRRNIAYFESDENIDEQFEELMSNADRFDKEFIDVYIKHKSNLKSMSKASGQSERTTRRAFNKVKESLQRKWNQPE